MEYNCIINNHIIKELIILNGAEQLWYIFRILIAGICGILVGLERKNRSKEAGIKTHFVVASGAALIMIVSKYAFFDVADIAKAMNFAGEIRLDPSRVASTIASGIGFLGAGMIFVHKNTVTGLTTAAGIWATSGIGMAIGAGMYTVGIGATLLIIMAQILMHIDYHRSKNARLKTLSIKGVTEPGYRKSIMAQLEEMNIQIYNTSVEQVDEQTRNYVLTIELPATVDEDDIITMVKYKSSIKPCL